MGADLYLNPPADDRFMMVTSPTGHGAIYRYQPDSIYRYASPDWVLVQLVGEDRVEAVSKAMRAVGIPVRSFRTNYSFKNKINRDLMGRLTGVKS